MTYEQARVILDNAKAVDAAAQAFDRACAGVPLGDGCMQVAVGKALDGHRTFYKALGFIEGHKQAKEKAE